MVEEEVLSVIVGQLQLSGYGLLPGGSTKTTTPQEHLNRVTKDGG